MPFGLKNVGAIYKRAMQIIFDDMFQKTVECYVDDLMIKSKKRVGHVRDICHIFQRLRRCQLKMNHLECVFGVTFGRFLGFIVHHKGNEIDQSKIKAIQEMPMLKNLKELRGLQGCLAYIRRFISNLVWRYYPFSHLIKKGVPFELDKSCRVAFEK